MLRLPDQKSGIVEKSEKMEILALHDPPSDLINPFVKGRLPVAPATNRDPESFQRCREILVGQYSQKL